MPDETVDIRLTLTKEDHARLKSAAALVYEDQKDYAVTAIMQRVDEDEVKRSQQAAKETQARIRAEERQG